jgi:hypothetical protein
MWSADRNPIYSCATETEGVRQGWGLSPYLYNIVVNDVIEYLDTEETHSPVINRLRIPGLLFADDLAIASSTSCGLQKKFELVEQYCKNCNLQFNLSKSKIKAFTKGG